MPAAMPVRVAASMIVSTSLLSDMVDIIGKLFFQLMASLHCESFSSHCKSSSL